VQTLFRLPQRAFKTTFDLFPAPTRERNRVGIVFSTSAISESRRKTGRPPHSKLNRSVAIFWRLS